MYGPWQSQDNIRGVVGVIPGELINEHGSANNSITTVYTVPAGNTLYITWYSVGYSNDTSGNVGYAQVQDSSGVTVLYLGEAVGPVDHVGALACGCPTPIVVASGNKIVVGSTAQGLEAYLSFQGFLQ